MRLASDGLKFLVFAGLYRLLAFAGVLLAMIFAGGMARWFLATFHWLLGLVGLATALAPPS